MTKPIRFEHLQGCIDWWGGPTRKGREESAFAWKVTAEQVRARGYDLDIKILTRSRTIMAIPRSCLSGSLRQRLILRAYAIS